MTFPKIVVAPAQKGGLFKRPTARVEASTVLLLPVAGAAVVGVIAYDGIKLGIQAISRALKGKPKGLPPAEEHITPDRAVQVDISTAVQDLAEKAKSEAAEIAEKAIQA